MVVLSVVVLLILSVAGGYFVWERSIASATFQRGVLNYQQTGDLEAARQSTVNAINMVSSDVYWRGLTQILLVDLSHRQTLMHLRDHP